MTLPTDDEIEALHRKHAPDEEAFQSVYTHCRIVADITDQMIDRMHPEVDREVVRVGCLLHDIGVYRLYQDGIIDESRYICHGVLGAELLLAPHGSWAHQGGDHCARPAPAASGLSRRERRGTAGHVRRQVPLEVRERAWPALQQRGIVYKDRIEVRRRERPEVQGDDRTFRPSGS